MHLLHICQITWAANLAHLHFLSKTIENHLYLTFYKRYSHLGYTGVRPHNCHLTKARKIRKKRRKMNVQMSQYDRDAEKRAWGLSDILSDLCHILSALRPFSGQPLGEHIWSLACTAKVFGWCRWLDRDKRSASADVWSDRKRWHYCKKWVPLKCCCKKCPGN